MENNETTPETTSMENNETTPETISMKSYKPLFILLPMCTELETDVFLNILKKAVGRKKLDDHYINHALKLGMSADKFSLKEEDISGSWNEIKSKDNQIRQSRLLGYWAINNFPSLGKKLLGNSWQIPKRQSLQVIGHSKEISAEDIDELVFQKLKIRVMQCNVEPTTMVKLSHFVNVPANIGKKNEFEVSKKIKSFDLDDEWTERCWKALKLGSFSLDGNYEQINSSTVSSQIDSSVRSSRSAHKRSCTHDVTENIDLIDDLSVGGELTIGTPSKRPHLVTKNVNSTNALDIMLRDSTCNSQSDLSLRRTNRETVNVNLNSNNVAHLNGDSRIDTIQAVLLDIRKDTGNLNDLFSSSIADKDKEITRLNSYVHELLNANQMLTACQLNSKEQIEGQSALINALQKGVDANSKLLVQSERDLNKWKDYATKKDDELKITQDRNEKLQEEKTKLQEESDFFRLQIDLILPENRTKSDVETQTPTNCEVVHKLAQAECDLSASLHLIDKMKLEATQARNEIQSLADKLAASEKSKLEMDAKNETLDDDLNKLKDYATKKDAELKIAQDRNENLEEEKSKLQEECDFLRLQIDLILPENRTKSDVETQTPTNCEVVHKLAQAECDLSASLHLIDKMKLEATQARNEIQSLADKLAASEKSKLEMDAKNETLDDDLNKWKDYATKKDAELKTAQEVFNRNEKLEKELNALSYYVDEMVPNLQSQIGNLENNLSAAEKINSESVEQKRMLHEECDALRLQINLLLPENRTKSDVETQTPTYSEVEHKLAENQKGVTSGIEPNANGCVSSENLNDQGLHSDAMGQVSANDKKSYASSSDDPIGIEPNNSQQVGRDNQELNSEQIFVTDDPIVQKLRPLLLKLQFAWVTFQTTKKAKFCPAFIHPVDPDGKVRAQKVTRDGYVTNVKSVFFKIGNDNIAKQTSEVANLNNLNKKFGFSLK